MILLEREKLLSELEQKIGYSFRSRALLDRALTHRSFANERVAEKCLHNEALEFLGDAVLGFIVSAWLLERFPELSEGKLSKMKAYLVSEASLVELAEDIDLGRYILLNRGEEKTGGRQKRALLADAYEALIGVLYIDGGISVAERFLRHELRHKVTAIDPTSMIGTDYKSALQEQLQAAGASAPDYAVVEVLGPDHRRTFRVELRVSGRPVARGEGHTIKIAQQDAARAALADPAALRHIASGEGNDPPVDGDEGQAFDGFEVAPGRRLSSGGDDHRPHALAGMDGARDSFERIGGREESAATMAPASFAGPAGARPESGDNMELSADAETEDEARGVATDA
jgi:ribonuclease-3